MRKELVEVTTVIDALTEEKKMLDALFSSGQTLDNVAELSRRYTEITGILDEKEFRWLELSEFE